MTPEETYRRILSNHLPPEAVDWVYRFLDRYRVHFHITRERRSKLGDYRWPHPAMRGAKEHPFHEISVNGNLNPYRFLWVFIHEAAHLETHLRHGDSVAAHGHEWQEEYCRLLQAQGHLFPAEVQPLIARFARRVPMERAAGRQAEVALLRYDNGTDATPPTTLDDLHPDARFRLKSRPQMLFVALERRRTRWRCREVGSGRDYLVSGSAEVLAVD
ncbi:MAG: hypothetical protein IJ745_01520 [Bacteroidales bacterium]|nr:hypothetical protein [Bacteroidales bacterium]